MFGLPPQVENWLHLQSGKMWVAILLTVLSAAGSSIGKALQKKATNSLPRLAFERKVIQAYLGSATWLLGLLADIGGALLMISAVSRAPVSIVQPVSGSGLALLALFSHYYLHEPLFAADWVGVCLACAGIIGSGLTAEVPVDDSSSTLQVLPALLCVTVMGTIMVACDWYQRRQRRQRHLSKGRGGAAVLGFPSLTSARAQLSHIIHGPDDSFTELAAGMQAGICFGLSVSACRTGFLLHAQGFPAILLPLGVMFSVGLSSLGFIYQTRALKDGRAVVISAVAALASIGSGVVIGMAALDERMPTSTGRRIVRILSWACSMSAVLLLSRGAPSPRGSASGRDRRLPALLMPSHLWRRFLKRKENLPKGSGRARYYGNVGMMGGQLSSSNLHSHRMGDLSAAGAAMMAGEGSGPSISPAGSGPGITGPGASSSSSGGAGNGPSYISLGKWLGPGGSAGISSEGRSSSASRLSEWFAPVVVGPGKHPDLRMVLPPLPGVAPLLPLAGVPEKRHQAND
eukprot:jgi/Mesvir1/3191/Mv16346-RA.1